MVSTLTRPRWIAVCAFSALCACSVDDRQLGAAAGSGGDASTLNPGGDGGSTAPDAASLPNSAGGSGPGAGGGGGAVSPGPCDGGGCAEECSPTALRCNPSSGVPQLCNEQGRWQDQTACGVCQACTGNAECQPVLEAEDPGSCEGENGCDQAGVCRIKVVAVATGNNGCAVLADGSVRCWGSSGTGANGPSSVRWQDAEAGATRLRFTGARAVDVQGNDYFYCALLDDGSARCWGSGFYGQLGQESSENIGDDPAETPDTYARIAFASPIVQLSIGSETSCARLANGSVRCWGRSVWMGVPLASDQYIGDAPGEEPATFPELAFGEAVVDLATGNTHRCAVLASGIVRCWGDGFGGKLGNGSGDTVGGPDVPAPSAFPSVSFTGGIAAAALSSQSSCVLLRDDSTVRCWGRWSSAGVDTFIGDVPGETSDQFLEFPFGEPLTQVDGGYLNFCGLDAQGRAVCWGAGNLGQLGNGATDFVGDSVLETPATFPRIAFGSPIINLDLDFQGGGACAVLSSGSLRCWGGSFGPSDTNTNIGDDELASEAAPFIPIRPLSGT